MLLDRIDVSKSSGPDKLPGRLLQSLAKEITPVVHFIVTQSLCTGELPTEWTQANVAPIFKKGSKLQAVNYRPVSLTCITCKLFEHLICKHILAHLEDHKILTDLQHGFRSGRSCETQLVTTFQDLAQMHNKKGSQIDISVLDFSKAFATVPHDDLLLRRNLKGCPEKLKQTAYFSLVRSFSLREYGATVWDPYQKYNSDKIERVQRRAARFVKSRYSRYSSVSDMLDELGWTPLSQRRQEARLIVLQNY